jgi:hypothetical protein
MKHPTANGLAVLLLCLGATPVDAQNVASSFDQLTALVNPRDKIIVVDLAGGETQGRIAALSGDKLTLVTPAGPRELGEALVAEIRQRRRDSLQNGAVIGAAAGAGYGLAMLTLASIYGDGGDLMPASVVTGMVIFTGTGAAIGAGIDALIARTQTIYRKRSGAARLSVSPLFGGGRRGAAVTIDFPR